MFMFRCRPNKIFAFVNSVLPRLGIEWTREQYWIRVRKLEFNDLGVRSLSVDALPFL